MLLTRPLAPERGWSCPGSAALSRDQVPDKAGTGGQYRFAQSDSELGGGLCRPPNSRVMRRVTIPSGAQATLEEVHNVTGAVGRVSYESHSSPVRSKVQRKELAKWRRNGSVKYLLYSLPKVNQTISGLISTR
jgi:hypothetical protein